MFAKQDPITTSRSHRIAKQTCVLWIPGANGYLADFKPDNFRIVDHPSQANSYDEETASRDAISFRQATGLRAAVRPYNPQHAQH
jgi:hypothetical protein